MCTVCHGLFAFPLGVIDGECTLIVTLPEHLCSIQVPVTKISAEICTFGHLMVWLYLLFIMLLRN